MDASAYREKDRRALWHPFSRRTEIDSSSFPILCHGKGVYLFDIDGRRYLDAISSWWACNLGHSHPRLVKAIRAQAEKLQHSILGNMSHPPAIELAEMISTLFDGRRRVFFASDGACAVEAALKIAVQHWRNLDRPKKRRLVSLKNAYHGDTLGAVAVGYCRQFHSAFRTSLRRARQAESPCCGTCAWKKEPASCELECFESMREILTAHSEETAAVIVEPLCQAAGGMRIYSERYLKELDRLCGKLGVLLIADEIAVGFGRTGEMFAFERAGIDPDIVCVGKGLSGGTLPISAAVVKENVYESFNDSSSDRTFYHGHTFAGNPIAAAAGIEALKIYEEEEIARRARSKGQLLLDGISSLKDYQGVVDVRGLGMIVAVEFKPARKGSLSSAKLAANELLAEGILVRPLGDVLYLMPPLVTTEKVLERLAAKFQAAVRKASR